MPQSDGQFSAVSPDSQTLFPQIGQLMSFQFLKGLPDFVMNIIIVLTISQARKIMINPMTTEVKIFLAVPILPGSPAAVKNITPPITIIKMARGKRTSFAKKSMILLNKTKR
jgi:hypothetical protein